MQAITSRYSRRVTDPTDELARLPRYLQLLWGREPAGRRGPKPARSIHDIAAAAVAIGDQGGYAAISMTSVAARVGMTTMSLYRYVDSKDELDQVILDAALGRPRLTLTEDDADWQQRLVAWGRATAETYLRHAWTVDVPVSEPSAGPNTLAWMEAGLGALDRLELDDARKLSTLLVVSGYTRDHVRLATQLGATAGHSKPDLEADYADRMRLLVEPAQLPRLARAQSAFAPGDDDFFYTELEFGLDLIVQGLAAVAS